ncbi:MAG: hypothetical protein K2K88_03545 [Muribaculaceae bacterium]|nr:hypothetical protein [Muribaculaceae bacterium]MDE6352202.1 hypothetical protein [Muribaculaceae bacterium]MDE6643761.1 hypothetical protein [Muribaculaceae bacterium]
MRVIKSIFIFLIFLSLWGCTSQNVIDLQEVVKDINFVCPLNEGPAGDLLSVEYDQLSNIVTMDLAADGQLTDVEKLREHRDLQLDCLRLSFNDLSASRLLNAMVNAKASLNVVYINQNNNQTVNFKITNKELRKELESQATIYQRDSTETAARVALENAMCPREIGPGIYIQGVEILGNNILYSYRIDSEFKGKSLETEKDSIEHAIYYNISELLNHQRRGRELRQVAQLGYGLVYLYDIDKIGGKIDIVVPSDTLVQMVKESNVNHVATKS